MEDEIRLNLEEMLLDQLLLDIVESEELLEDMLRCKRCES